MDSPDSKNEKPQALSWWLVLSIGLVLSVLTFWTWQKWDTAWIGPSEGFFPPEWQNEDLETLAWKYPIYRSNDTYQWVHLADALAEGNSIPLHHRFDEGLPEGRPNRWHSGLAYLLSAGGSLTAAFQDWPTQRGIHQLAHWLGAAIQIAAIILGSFLLSLLAGRRAALLFAGLYFFNAAVAWDFAFSRLDHEALFQFFLLFHVIGLAGILDSDAGKRSFWAILAGISAGFCWWISATVMAALSILTTMGLAAECVRSREANERDERKGMTQAIMLWGGSAAGMIFLFCLLDKRLTLEPQIATIHPIFIFAQIGAALCCLAVLLRSRFQQALALGFGAFCALSPALWIAFYKSKAHPWLDPMMRRLHDYIVEFQSPLSNGLWNQSESLQALAIAILALFALRPFAKARSALFACLIIGLLLLAGFQTRWLGLLATVGTLGLCLHLKRGSSTPTVYLSFGLILVLLVSWTNKWLTIEKNPRRIFITDLMLQVGARDINLNLQNLSQGEKIHVAMPYAFSATSALFPEVHPIGTFYWENKAGIAASANFFAGFETNARIDYAVVQGGRQGIPFARLATWVALGDDGTKTVEQSLAWQLAHKRTPIDGWEELLFDGSFSLGQFSVRIYEATEK